MSEVLLIDDDQPFRESLAQSLMIEGFNVREYAQPLSVLPHINPLNEMIVVCDVRMPKLSGEQLRERIHEIDPDVPVLMITGHGDVSMAVSNLKAGAFSFFSKPIDLADFFEDCRKATQVRQAVVLRRKMEIELDGRNRLFQQINGSSKPIQELRRQVSGIASRDTNVLITGETGVGKDVIARAMHSISKNSMQPFVAVNSAFIDEPGSGGSHSLFGQQDEAGLFERAGHGTLFLDDIESMPLAVQAKLLRTLEERRYRKPEASQSQPVMCRVVATAKPSLTQSLADGRFRDDLFYRLQAERVSVPPLRQRKADCAMLFELFASQAAQSIDRAMPVLDPETLAWVMSQDWPGNVRELKNIAEQWGMGEPVIKARLHPVATNLSLADQVAQFECSLIQSHLETNGYDIRRTTESLKVPRKTLTDKITKYGLVKPRQ